MAVPADQMCILSHGTWLYSIIPESWHGVPWNNYAFRDVLGWRMVDTGSLYTQSRQQC